MNFTSQINIVMNILTRDDDYIRDGQLFIV